MGWPAQSPDKSVWDELDRSVKAKQPASATHFGDFCNRHGKSFFEESLISIVERTSQVCSAVTSAYCYFC